MSSSISISHHNHIESPPQNTNETNDHRNIPSQPNSKEQEATSINLNTPVFSIPKITITDPKNTDSTDLNAFTSKIESYEQNPILLKVGVSGYNCITDASSTPHSDNCYNYNKRLETIRETNSELYETKRLQDSHSVNIIKNNISNNEDSSSIQVINDTKFKRSTIISNNSVNNVPKNTSRITQSFSYKDSFGIGLDNNSVHTHKVNQSKSWKYKYNQLHKIYLGEFKYMIKQE